jgi:hypothetical protein
MKKIFLVATIAIGFASCKKQENTTEKLTSTVNSWSIGSILNPDNNTYGSVHYGYHQVGFGKTTNGYFQLGGDFFSDTPNTAGIDVGQMTFNGNNFSYSASVTPSYSFSSSQATDYTLNSSNFGGNNTFTFSGNGGTFPACSATLYNPTMLDVSCNITNVHSKANNITLTWNSDPSNPNGEIHIVLNYQPGPSIRLNGTNPTSAPVIKMTTADDGSHTINSSVLSGLSSGTIWSINIIRFNEIIQTISGKEYQFATYSTIEKEFTLNP